MAKPIVNKVSTFDAADGTTVTFSYSGALPYGNRIIIYAAESMTSVYDDTVTSFSMSHEIPSGVLRNGVKYAIQCQCFDSSGSPSSLSDKAYFYCTATPTFGFSNIHDGDTLNVASIYAKLTYTQENFEDISEYRFYLYSETKSVLIESETFYGSEDLGYTFRGFTNDTIYYVRAVGLTENGMSLDTGYLKIFVSYENPDDYRFIYTDCNSSNGVVTYSTNFVVINPTDDDGYEYSDGYINLTDNTLVYDKDFIVNGNFTMSIRGRDMYRTATLLKCANDGYGFTLSSYIYDDGGMRFKLTVPNGLCNYILYSPPITPYSLDIVTVHIRRVDNVYQLECFVEEGVDDEQHNMWFGESRPNAVDSEVYDIWIDNGKAVAARVDRNDVNVFYRGAEPSLISNTEYDVWIGD
jgi:hypothetical protein